MTLTLFKDSSVMPLPLLTVVASPNSPHKCPWVMIDDTCLVYGFPFSLLGAPWAATSRSPSSSLRFASRRKHRLLQFIAILSHWVKHALHLFLHSSRKHVSHFLLKTLSLRLSLSLSDCGFLSLLPDLLLRSTLLELKILN